MTDVFDRLIDGVIGREGGYARRSAASWAVSPWRRMRCESAE